MQALINESRYASFDQPSQHSAKFVILVWKFCLKACAARRSGEKCRVGLFFWLTFLAGRFDMKKSEKVWVAEDVGGMQVSMGAKFRCLRWISDSDRRA